MADVRRIWKMRDDKTALAVLIQKGSVGDDLLVRFAKAEKELESEVLDVVNEANSFTPAWGPGIFQTASEMVASESTNPVLAHRGVAETTLTILSLDCSQTRSSRRTSTSSSRSSFARVSPSFLHQPLHTELTPISYPTPAEAKHRTQKAEFKTILPSSDFKASISTSPSTATLSPAAPSKSTLIPTPSVSNVSTPPASPGPASTVASPGMTPSTSSSAETSPPGSTFGSAKVSCSCRTLQGV
jgi:hypothetical protein